MVPPLRRVVVALVHPFGGELMAFFIIFRAIQELEVLFLMDDLI